MKKTAEYEVLHEGKTKIVKLIPGVDNLVLIESKNDITAFDDPSKTKVFGTKGEYATNTTCRVFELLKAAGIPVAYDSQLSPLEFKAPKCRMIPLEVIARRYAVGSYLKRFPNLIATGTPHRFHDLKIEFFLKTTGGKLVLNDDVSIEVDSAKGEEDPFILNHLKGNWELYHSKKPAWDPDASLKKNVDRDEIFDESIAKDYGSADIVNEIIRLTRLTFLVLESAWAQQNMRLIDFKIEFGFDMDGNLLVADVIDNDSWRLRDESWKELSKESFRQGEELGEVEKKYGIVSRMVNNFRIPKQCLVVWTGSHSDPSPSIPVGYNSLVSLETVVLSGHKSPQACLDKLEELMSKYPDGGAILVKVGRSNGLGPILAARTNWPVIAIPATMKDYPEDIWSSIRMPSDVPLMTAWPEENAVLIALNILAQKNPAIYAERQLKIESLDK